MRKLNYLFIALFLCFYACPLTFTLESWAREKFTVVIDAGHGGGDIGTPHRKQKQDEKKVALNVALKLGKLIEAYNKDVNVVYTRKTDIYPSLPERTQIAKKAKGDLFISIHVNAAPDASARGFETYVFGVSSNTADEKKRLQDRMADERENLDISGKMVNFDTDIDIETKILCQAQREKHNKQSLEVADDIHGSLIKELKKSNYASNVNNRGVKPKNLFVLCYSPMPAILIELGYMSNPTEERFIASDEGQTCFALGIYNGFKKYKRDWEKRQLTSSDTVSPEPEPVAAKEEPAKKKKEEAQKPAEPKKEEAKKPVETKKEEAPKTSEPKKEEAKKPAEPTKKEEAKPAEKVQPVTEQPKRQEPISTQSEITWRVQFLTSGKEFKEGDRELKGLWPVYCYKDGAVYKYTYGSAPSQKELSKDMQKVKALFKDAFPVKFDKDGKRIK